MAKVDKSAIHDFYNGEIVTEAALDQNFELLRIANNDNYDRLIKKFEVLDKNGNVKTTLNLDTAINYLKFKEGDLITLSLDTTNGILQISALDTNATAKMADGSVTTAKIADGAITRQKIADAAINLAKLDLNDLDTRYYTESELNNGALDKRYYTESELSGSGGASKIGITPINGLTASNTQQALEEINSRFKQYTLGQIPDGSITLQKLAFDPATQAELDTVINNLNTHLAETASKFTNINLNIIDMAVELETLKGATLNGVTANIFVETFTNLNDINLMNGIYDNINKRLVLY